LVPPREQAPGPLTVAGCAAAKVDSDAMALILMFQVARWVFDVFAWILARTVL